jgi:hypothetical protein
MPPHEETVVPPASWGEERSSNVGVVKETSRQYNNYRTNDDNVAMVVEASFTDDKETTETTTPITAEDRDVTNNSLPKIGSDFVTGLRSADRASENRAQDVRTSTGTNGCNEETDGQVLSTTHSPRGIERSISILRSRVQARVEERKRRNQEEQARAAEAASNAAAEAQARALSVLESTAAEASVESLRASKISITVVREGVTTVYGLGIGEGDADGHDGGKTNHQKTRPKKQLTIDVLDGDGILHNAPLQVGDVLKTVNNKVVTEYREAIVYMLSLEGPVTMTVETPNGNSHVVHAYGRKPAPETKVGVQFQVLRHGEHSLLQVHGTDNDGLLAHSVLSPGDLVLAINGTAATHMSPDEATELVESSSVDAVSIVAMDPKAVSDAFVCQTRSQRWLRQAKRAGIAVGGGAMVGVGLVLVPSLGPVGEILIIGGVSVLGTEFEGPKRVVRSARDSLERVVGRSGDDSAATPTLAAIENDCNPDGSTAKGCRQKVSESQTPPRAKGVNETNEDDVTADDHTADGCESSDSEDPPIADHEKQTHGESANNVVTMRNRFKSFGRNYVLPLLDHVVGDREEHRKEGCGTNQEYVCEDPIAEEKNLQFQEKDEANSIKVDAAADGTAQGRNAVDTRYPLPQRLDENVSNLTAETSHEELALMEEAMDDFQKLDHDGVSSPPQRIV